jgi:hypothetical protein
MLKANGLKKLFCICVKGLLCVLEKKIKEKFYWSSWKELNNCMSYLLWQIIFL